MPHGWRKRSPQSDISRRAARGGSSGASGRTSSQKKAKAQALAGTSGKTGSRGHGGKAAMCGVDMLADEIRVGKGLGGASPAPLPQVPRDTVVVQRAESEQAKTDACSEAGSLFSRVDSIDSLASLNSDESIPESVDTRVRDWARDRALAAPPSLAELQSEERARQVEALKVEAESQPEANVAVVSALRTMGFARELCETAALCTGNECTEIAARWILENMEEHQRARAEQKQPEKTAQPEKTEQTEQSAPEPATMWGHQARFEKAKQPEQKAVVEEQEAVEEQAAEQERKNERKEQEQEQEQDPEQEDLDGWVTVEMEAPPSSRGGQ